MLHVLSLSRVTKFLDHLLWVCTNVYGPNLRHLNYFFYNEISRCHTHLPWVIFGDFNAIFSLEDKNKCIPNLGDTICSQI